MWRENCFLRLNFHPSSEITRVQLRIDSVRDVVLHEIIVIGVQTVVSRLQYWFPPPHLTPCAIDGVGPNDQRQRLPSTDTDPG